MEYYKNIQVFGMFFTLNRQDYGMSRLGITRNSQYWRLDQAYDTLAFSQRYVRNYDLIIAGGDLFTDTILLVPG